jgi:uncharacterized membrane protein
MNSTWIGPHAPALRHVVVSAVGGLVVGVVASTFLSADLAVLCGWDAAAFIFLAMVWPHILSASPMETQSIATHEDLTRDAARLLLLLASSASVVAVGLAMVRARHETGTERWTLVGIAALTIVISWSVVNTQFLLRYAHLYYSCPPGAVEFAGAGPNDEPDYRDFAYLAFTIGMCYQVSDTALHRELRRTALVHAVMSYVFGVVIVSTGVNIIAGLG